MNCGRLLINSALLILLAIWGAFLIMHAKQKSSYVMERAIHLAPLDTNCKWIGINKNHQASLGLSLEPERAWIDRTQAYIAFQISTSNNVKWLDFDIHAVVAKQVILSVDGFSERYRITDGGKIRLPIPSLQTTEPRIVMIRFKSEGMERPNSKDHRWRSAAIGALRLCEN